MKVVINGSEADYPYIFVNGVKMPATFIARPANPRVDMGRRIIIEPALPEGGNVLLTANYLDFEINETVISDNPSAYTPADVLKLLNEGYKSPTGDDFPGIGSGLYSGGGGSPEIPDGSITTAKLADNAVTSAKIKPSAVGTSQLADDAVTTAKIANGSIIQNHLQIDSVGYPQIIDGSVDSTILADNSVTTNKIVDGAVTEAKLAPSSVATEKLQDLCVTTPKIADQAVDTTKLNTGGSRGGECRVIDMDKKKQALYRRLFFFGGSIPRPALPNTSIMIPATKNSTHALLMTMLLFRGGTQARSGHTKTWGFCRE